MADFSQYRVTNTPQDNIDFSQYRVNQAPVPAAPAPTSAPGVPIPAPLAPAVVEPTISDRLATALRGYGQGATAGLIQYPQAALKSVVTGLPLSESLEDLRAENVRLSQQQPGAWYSGKILGGGVLGAATGGGSLPAIVAKGAATGAVEGLTQKEQPLDALTGAATGGALSALFGGAGKAATAYLGNKQISLFQNNWKSDPIDYRAKIYRFMNDIPDNQPVKASDIMRTPSAGEIRKLYDKIGTDIAFSRGFTSGIPSIGQSLVGLAKETGQQITSTIPTAIAGALTGSAFQQPGLGALIGASLVPAGRAIMREGPSAPSPAIAEMGRQALMYPSMLPRTGTTAAGILQPTVVEATVEQTNPPEVPKKRLVEVAERFKQNWLNQ